MDYQDALGQILIIVVPAIAALVVALLGFGAAYLKKKTDALKNDQAERMVDKAIDTARAEVATAVMEINQTLIDDIKAARSDGKLTAEERGVAFERAKALFFRRMPEAGLKTLQGSVGDLSTWVAGEIEAAVAETKIKNS